MQSTEETIPFRITTYKLNYHSINSSHEGIKDRILRDPHTDVWCLQGVNLRKQLKSLPSIYEFHFTPGLAFVHNKEHVQVIDTHFVNVVQLLLAAAHERPLVTDSFCVSHFHLSKLKICAGFVAYEILPRHSPTATTSSPPLHFMQVATHRALVVNVDLEKYRKWGDAFFCNVLHVLFCVIWNGPNCLTKRWGCTHVFLAGSFFFPPGSPPYQLMTSLSGGLVEEIVSHIVVPPFKRIAFDENETGDASNEDTTLTCVAVVESQGSSHCRQLLAVQMRRGGADGTIFTPADLRLSCVDPNTGNYDAEMNLSYAAEGWWMLPAPRDTSKANQIVARLEFSCDNGTVEEEGAQTDISICFRVRSFGVLPPGHQDADGLCVGQPLLRSATAGTVSVDAAAQFCGGLRLRMLSTTHLARLMSDARQALGEPVATALYKEEADILPDCYDYVFVATFTGTVVQDASVLTLADFVAEPATPHLPISCTVAVPCALQ